MARALRKEEGLGLGIAIAAHAALVAVLLLRPQAAPVVQPPERIEVTISDEVGLTSTSPEPNSQAAPPVAPTLGEPKPAEPAEAEPEPASPEPAPPPPPTPPKPQPRPEPKPEPKPEPRPAPKPQPRPVPKPKPKPAPRQTARPTPPKPVTKTPPKKTAPAPPQKAPPRKTPAKPSSPARTPSKAPAKQAETRSPPAKAPARPSAPSGGSQIGSDFLSGVTGAKSTVRTPAASPPAAAAGPAVKSALASAISRQLKPRWQAPQGPQAEELVTILSFNLNRDGTLAGSPTVVRQLGINDTNRNQAARHAEQAIRAVRLAAPFDLPDQYYDAWKRVSSFRFDKRLSQ
jgi:outer membrane biosynthesis protein TonB